jgi:hypothetical protein
LDRLCPAAEWREEIDRMRVRIEALNVRIKQREQAYVRFALSDSTRTVNLWAWEEE